MLESKELITQCFEAISLEDTVEQLEQIPSVLEHFISCWCVLTEISTPTGIEDIKLYIGFEKHFPYTLPEIYYLDEKYDYFPHIGYQDRKLCLWENGVTYSTDDCVSLIRECIRRAKRLLEQSSKKENITDFQEEIWSHWISRFENEKQVSTNWLVYGSIPTESCKVRIWKYEENISSENKSHHYLIVAGTVEPTLESYFSQKPAFREYKALYLNKVRIPEIPPFCIKPKFLSDWITESDDFKIFKHELNKQGSLIVIFPLLSSKYIGGFCIPKQPSKRKGFSKISPFDELTKFEKKYINLKRIAGKIYSRERIAERTSEQAIPKDFILTVVGLGSIGSNLCYFLDSLMPSGYNLIDNDVFNPENIGRHLLGMRFLYQSKAGAMEEYLREKRPDLCIFTYKDSFLNVDKMKLSSSKAIFLCTGDTMVDEYVVELIQENKLNIPVFILWLEPFSIAGHMVYINPYDKPERILLNQGCQLLYKYNLIKDSEYKEKGETQFTRKDAGCNGKYAVYSGNDVTQFLSSIYPVINKLLSNPNQSKCYRWQGNINLAKEKGIKLNDYTPSCGLIEELSL